MQGKTLQALALIMHSTNGQPTLVITPLAVLYVWKREIEARLMLSPELVCVYHGQQRNLPAIHLQTYRIILTNYETIMSVCNHISLTRELTDRFCNAVLNGTAKSTA